jgi:hypothetical protein
MTAEDVRVGRQAMPISEVSLMLRSGTSQQAIVADVTRRHIPEKISVALESELTTNGAKPALIAALKDDENILTENQKNAFDQWVASRAAPNRPVVQQNAASVKLNADQAEHQRLLALQQENIRNVERRQNEQAAKDREQARSHSRYEAQNDHHGQIYGIIRRGDRTDGYGHVISRPNY